MALRVCIELRQATDATAKSSSDIFKASVPGPTKTSTTDYPTGMAIFEFDSHPGETIAFIDSSASLTAFEALDKADDDGV